MSDIPTNPVTPVTNGAIVTASNPLPAYLVGGVPATSITVGTTTIASGTTTRILYDNAGVLGEYTISGSGTVVAMATSPVFTTPTLGVAIGTSLALGGATLGANALAVTGASALGDIVGSGFIVCGETSIIGFGLARSRLSSASDGAMAITASNGTTGAAVTLGSLTTIAPAGASAGVWKLGSLVAGAVTADTTRSLYVDVGGTVYKVIVST